jgi:uncharacterized protein YyaL (SSP411 family)
LSGTFLAMSEHSDYTNQLINETSPYLLQHAHNPVNWYPWGAAALEKARRENKPILLSVGYSACHWCHVMAHESFEDPDTADLMNRLFVNIKVDREERPDIDRIYQSAHSMLTRRAGGWPLTVFLTPDDHVPFFAGTYFGHTTPRHPAFSDLLQRVHDFLRENAVEILIRPAPAGCLAADEPRAGWRNTRQPALDTARQLLEKLRPATAAGQAPKFPHPTSLERL